MTGAGPFAISLDLVGSGWLLLELAKVAPWDMVSTADRRVLRVEGGPACLFCAASNARSPG